MYIVSETEKSNLDNTCYATVILDFIFQNKHISHKCKRISAEHKNLVEIDALIFLKI